MHEPLQHALAAEQAGDLTAAEALLRQAMADSAVAVECAVHLARVLTKVHRNGEACAVLESALSGGDAAQPEVWQNLAASLLELGQPRQAIEAANRAVKLRPGYTTALNVLGVAQATLGEHRRAVAAFREATASGGDYFEANQNLAQSLEQLGEIAEAAQIYRLLAEQVDHADAARFELAALGEGAAPGMPPAGYVERFFDAYAAPYEAHLTGELDYQAHRLLAAAIDKVGWPAQARVLDLGCGTGLLGPLVRPHAAQLVGVDVSQQMLRRAASKQLYDQLIQQDAVDYLQESAVQFDVIAAADVLIYLGDLMPLVAAAAQRLTVGGLLAVTIELGAAEPYWLSPQRRYLHAWAYVEQLAQTHRLSSHASQEGTLRLQDKHPVAGCALVFAKQEGAALS